MKEIPSQHEVGKVMQERRGRMVSSFCLAERRIMQDKRSWMLVLLFTGILVVSSLPQPVTAFNVIDKAMCKEIDFKTLTCKERTSEFLLTDEWAYLWFRGNFGKSDEGTKVELKFYDPGGLESAHMYGLGPGRMNPTESIPWPVGEWMLGETVVWMGIGVTKALAEGAVVSSNSDPSGVEALVKELRGSESRETLKGDADWEYFVWAYRNKQPASEKAGEWRAEFTLDGRVVVSERFNISDKVTLTVQIKPGKSNVPVSIDGSPINTDPDGKVQVKVSVAGPHTIQVPSEVSILTGTKIIFVKWEDGQTSNSRTLRPADATTLTAEYKTQYLLTVISPLGNPQGSGWYDEGASTTFFSVTSPWTAEGFMGMLGGKYIFERWSGDLTATTTSASVRMDGPKTVTAEWRADNTMPYTIIGAIGAAIIVIVALALAMKRRKK